MWIKTSQWNQHFQELRTEEVCILKLIIIGDHGHNQFKKREILLAYNGKLSLSIISSILIAELLGKKM